MKKYNHRRNNHEENLICLPRQNFPRVIKPLKTSQKLRFSAFFMLKAYFYQRFTNFPGEPDLQGSTERIKNNTMTETFCFTNIRTPVGVIQPVFAVRVLIQFYVYCTYHLYRRNMWCGWYMYLRVATLYAFQIYPNKYGTPQRINSSSTRTAVFRIIWCGIIDGLV